MPRRMRGADPGYLYHVLNRAVARATLFAKPSDYAGFEKIPRQATGAFVGIRGPAQSLAPGCLARSGG